MSDPVRLCALADLEDGSARRFEVGSNPVAVVRIGDEVYAIGDTCSHEDYSLSEGEVLAEELELECWKHGSTFDLLTGSPCSLPATRSVRVYSVTMDGGDVYLDPGPDDQDVGS